MLKQVIFSNKNEYTPLYIKTNFRRRKITYNNTILDNLFKYLPIETETPEETENLLISHGLTYKHNHPFIEHTSDLSEYIPFTRCKICGDTMLFHRHLRHNRKHHSLTKQYRSFTSFPSKDEVTHSNNNNMRCKSPSCKSKGVIRYYIETTECDICMDIKSKDEFVTLQCKHSYCRSCIYEHIANAINSNNIPIKCPDGSCGVVFNDEFVECYVNEETFNKYQKFIMRYRISLIPHAVYCPHPNCESYALKPENVNNGGINANDTTERIHVDNNNKKQIILTCVDNGHEFCMNCRQLPHKGRDCDLKEEQGWSMFRKENNLKKCPKCGIEIYKDEGCNHMTCTKCKYQFCWICEKKYTSSHYNNPFIPCFHMQFTNQRHILIRSPYIRALKLIGIILLILIALPIVFAIPELIGMGAGIFFLFDEYSYRLSRSNRVIYFITLIFLGIAMVSFGYLLLCGVIISTPVIITYIITRCIN
jgi:hypothetical protein